MIQPERRTYSLSSRVYIWLDLHRVSRNGETTKNEHSADAGRWIRSLSRCAYFLPSLFYLFEFHDRRIV